MRYLYKLFHEKNAAEFDTAYQERWKYDSTARLGLTIKPINQPNTYEMFYVPTNKMLSMVSKIHSISESLQAIYNGLPRVAQNQFIIESLVEELYNTNELEGVRSTREEIARSAKEIILKKKSKKRFESMIKSYMRLLNKDIELPASSQDIRKIYDDITNGEIAQDELPDGDIFRSETTYVLKKSGSGKVIHKGIYPEKEIIQTMDHLINFMNEDTEIPMLIKVAIGHYYFGYIHPFYDGNGRTSRFISSIYLLDVLGSISALSLSRGCNTYKNKYLEAFEITNSIKSRGELNCFIETFLEMMMEALQLMNGELKEKSELLKIAIQKLEDEPRLDNKDDFGIMFVLAQNHFFDSGSGLTIKDLSEISDKSGPTIRKIVKRLISLSFIEQRGEKPAYYYIKQDYFEK